MSTAHATSYGVARGFLRVLRRALTMWTAVLTVAVSALVGLGTPMPSASAAPAPPAISSRATATKPGTLVAVTPARVFDSRLDGSRLPVPAQGTVVVGVGGRGGIPAYGVAAVAVNLTVTNPTSNGYLTAWAAGAPRPGTSNLNWASGQTLAHSAVVPVSGNGTMQVLNGSPTGTVHVVVDVSGYFLAGEATSPGAFVPLSPTRIVDTRNGLGAPKGPMADVTRTTLVMEGRGGIPASGVAAVVLNATVTQTTVKASLGFTDRDYHGSPTTGLFNIADSLYWNKGQTVSNLVMPTVTGGGVSYESNGGGGQLILDVVGYVRSGTIADSGALRPRIQFPLVYGATVSPGATLDVPLKDSLLGSNGLIDAALVNLAVMNGTAAGFLSVSPTGGASGTSSLNWVNGETQSNFAIVQVGSDGVVHVKNASSGKVDLTVNLAGWALAHDYPVDARWSSSTLDLSSLGSTSGALWSANGLVCTTTHVCAASGQDDRANGRGFLDLYDGSAWQKPTSVPNTGIKHLACFTSSQCLAVGGDFYGSSSFVALSGVSGWTVQTPAPSVTDGAGSAPPRLLGVACPGPSQCLAVGERRTTETPISLSYSTSSRTWTETPVPLPSGYVTGFLVNVTCSSATSCIGVGGASPSSAGTPLSTAAFRPMVSAWDGAAWTSSIIPTSAPQLATLTSFQQGLDVSCVQTRCVATGTASDDSTSPSTSRQFIAVGSTTGADWTVSAADAVASAREVTCRTADHCTTYGYLTPGIAQYDAGALTAVSLVADPTTATPTFDSVSCPSADRCVAVGRSTRTGVSADATVSQWTGSGWAVPSRLPLPATAVESNGMTDYGGAPRQVDCADSSFCMALGGYLDATGTRNLFADVLGR